MERADRLDREGEQVLSSLANVSQRVPLLLGGGHGPTAGEVEADAALGVLAFSEGTRERLLLRHFAALDKSRGFLTSVVRDYAELVVKLQTLLNDLLQVQTEILDQDGGSDGALGAMQRLEWMEDVARMLQRELARKQRLVEMVEYHDAARLASIHAQWPSRSRWGNVEAEYGTLRGRCVCVCLAGVGESTALTLVVIDTSARRFRAPAGAAQDCGRRERRRRRRRRREESRQEEAEAEAEEEELTVR